MDGLDGAYAVTVSPNGEQVFAGGRTDLAVAVFNRNTATCVLTFVETHTDGVDGVDGIDAPYLIVRAKLY